MRSKSFSTILVALTATTLSAIISGQQALAETSSSIINSTAAESQNSDNEATDKVESPDQSRSIAAIKVDGSDAISVATLLPGDQLRLSDDQKTIVWTSASGETVATLDATSGGRTPLNSFEVEGNTIKLHFFKDKICFKSWLGAATFGVSWEVAVCGAIGIAAPPAGLACGVGTALVTPLVPWDNACG